MEIYGIVDVGYSNHTINLNGQGGASAAQSVTKRSGIASSGQSSSRLGFRGTEDMGGGVKAGFTLEMSLAPAGTTDGNNGGQGGVANSGVTTSSQALSGFDNRQAFVSLGSEKTGTVYLGRQYTPMFTVMSTYNAGGTNNVVGDVSNTRDALATAPTNSMSGLRADGLTTAALINRASNTVSYVLPTFAPGLTSAVAVVDTRTQNNSTESGVKGSAVFAKYDQGAFSAAVGAMAATASNLGFTAQTATTLPASLVGNGLTTTNTAAAADIQITNSAYGASYDLGVTKLFFTRTSLSANAGATTDKRTSNKVGAQFPMGQWVHFVQYGQAVDKFTGAQDEKNTAYQLGTSYNFSKRTNAYAIYGKNKDTFAGVDGFEKQLAIGLRHQF